jgi:glycosyltransferase involved in cell wall biosynthesis
LYKVKKALLVSADFSIVVPSLWLKRKVEQSFLKDKKIYLVYNGIDTDVFKPYSKDESREELNLPKDKTIVTFASSGGLANTWKGIEYAYAVMNKFSNDDSVMFLSIGGINEEMKKVPNLVQIPYVKDKQLLAKYYSASDIFLSPTLAESFGLTIAEAMSCGTPVVSFGVGAVPELIDHMQNGFIARHKDVEGLAVGMRMLMADAMLAKKMSLSARDKIVEKFNLQKMLDGYESVYSETMATFKNARS